MFVRDLSTLMMSVLIGSYHHHPFKKKEADMRFLSHFESKWEKIYLYNMQNNKNNINDYYDYDHHNIKNSIL